MEAMIDEARKWELAARLRNKREVERAPLLAHAGLVPVHTPDDCKARKEAFVAAAIEQQRISWEKSTIEAARLRAKLEAVVSVDVIAGMADYCARVFPPHPVYACCFWRGECRNREIDPEDSQP